MSNGGALNYKLGGDASELQKAFETGLRYAGDSVNKIKAAFSVRGIFDGLVSGMQSALGGSNFSQIFMNALKGAMGKEVIQQNFEGMLGAGADNAKAAITALKSFAAEAGLSIEEVIGTARRMFGEGMNARAAVQDLQMLGEVSRGTGVSISGLGEIWGRMFSNGAVGVRELMHLSQENIPIYDALAKTMRVTTERVKELGGEGKITFDQMRQAMLSLTTGDGRFAGQIARYKGTLTGLYDQVRDTFAKIPGAFFEGIIGPNLTAAKAGLTDVKLVLDGWVASARDFGAQLGAAITVAKQLNAEGKLFGADGVFADAIEAAFGKGVDLMVGGLAGAANGFLAVLQTGLPALFNMVKQDFGEWFEGPIASLRELMGYEKLTEVKKPDAVNSISQPAWAVALGNSPEMRSDIASRDARTTQMKPGDGYAKIFADAFHAGNGARLGLGDDAAQRLKDTLGPRMFEARGGEAGALERMIAPFLRVIEKVMPNIGALGARNNPEAHPAGNSAHGIIAPDALARIGLFVGAGGPQGEAHARETAKNTAKALIQLKKMEGSFVDAIHKGLGRFSS